MKSLSVAFAISILSAAGHGQIRSDSTRHTVELPIPTQLKVRQTESQLSDTFDLTSLRTVRISVGKDMFVGVKYEIRVYRIGDPRPQSADRFGYASINEQGASSESGFLRSTSFWNRLPDGIPSPGERYTVEHDIMIFETDVPPGHFWHPEIAGRYRVLWNQRLKADSR